MHCVIWFPYSCSGSKKSSGSLYCMNSGTWLKVFNENGVTDILGIDGDYLDKTLLKIDPKNFKEYDLEKFYKSSRKYDLAISLEVAEHLSFVSADKFVASLTGLSNTLIFSAAIPYQGGQNHINEQKPEYWIKKFGDKGYFLLDILRPFFWDNENIDPWYRQNIFLFSNKKSIISKFDSFENFYGKHLVHPKIFQHKALGVSHYKTQFETLMKAIEDHNMGRDV